MKLETGATLGPYEILARIGEGGMGAVYKARDTRLDRFVAIKTTNAQFAERFQREAKAIAALNHPHICQLYDVGAGYLVRSMSTANRWAGRGAREHTPSEARRAERFSSHSV